MLNLCILSLEKLILMYLSRIIVGKLIKMEGGGNYFVF